MFPFVSGHYIRTFDGLSEVICVLMRRRRFEKTLTFVSARYTRTFDVIYEVFCTLLRRKRRIKINALYPKFDVIFEVNCVFVSETPRAKVQKNAPMCAQQALSELLKRCSSTTNPVLKLLYYFESYLIETHSLRYIRRKSVLFHLV